MGSEILINAFLISSALCQRSNERPLILTEKKDYKEKNGCVKYEFFLGLNFLLK